MRDNSTDARNRRLAALLVLCILIMSGVTGVWMYLYSINYWGV
jgi:hypothetical protein